MLDGIVRFFLNHLDDDITRVKVGRHEPRERGHGWQEHRLYFVCATPTICPTATVGGR